MTVGLAVLGVFVTYVPITGVSVSLNTISEATGANTADLQWVSDAYIIPMAAAVLSAGVFGDLHGRRRVYSLGMVLTAVGAVIAGFSSLAGGGTIALLWAGQAVSGLAAGMLLPTTLALIAHAVPDPHQRGRYVGMWATGMVVGLAVGPLLSGMILQFAGWGWIYSPIVVLAVIAGLFAHFKLPESKHAEGRHLDWLGQACATVAIAASIFGIIEGGSRGWGSPQAVIGLAIGALAITGFVMAEIRSDATLIDLQLFRSPAFSAAGFAALVALFAMVGTMFLLSIFLGAQQHLSPLGIGLRLLFITGVAAVVNPFAARLLTTTNPLTVLGCGLALSAAATVNLTGVNETTGFWDLAWRLAVFGVSVSLMLTPVSVVAINAAPWKQAGMAAAANTALRQYGAALGPAVLGAIFVSRVRDGATEVAALHTAFVTIAILLLAAATACALAVTIAHRARGSQKVTAENGELLNPRTG
jgi:EmrB/QacA subfamily drug resistance transporter